MTQLEETISKAYEELKHLKIGSDEYLSGVKAVAELEDIKQNDEKKAWEEFEIEKRAKLDEKKFEFEQKKYKEFWKDPKVVAAGVSGVISFVIFEGVKAFEAKGYMLKFPDIPKLLKF